jgi:hemolysin III
MGYIQSEKEELFNVITHGLGVLLSIVGIFILVINYDASLINLIYVIIYGLSLILLFSASTIYHYVSQKKYKRALRKLDHISIYVLIAGTYTPICMSVLKDTRGLLLLILVWSITGIGSILKLFFTGKFEKISLLLYLIMGWLIVLDFQNLYEAITDLTINYLILGGAFYTGGIVFYVLHKLKYHHVIWHVFVLLGALFHYLMIWNIVTV